MSKKLKYKDELIRSMNWLSKKKDTIFLGQSVSYSGNAIFNTLKNVPQNKKIELPVFEEMQMGISTGLALSGFTPITCYPRFDFFILSLNQLVNHLDKIKFMSNNQLKAKVMIRVAIGSKNPLDGGVQHTQDYSKVLPKMLTEVECIHLTEPKYIFNSFKKAYYSDHSSILIENGDFYNDK